MGEEFTAQPYELVWVDNDHACHRNRAARMNSSDGFSRFAVVER
jgi:hypothetical protein